MNEQDKLNERVEAVDNQVGTDTEDIDYISAISEMKKNSVSKESYEKVKQENKRLMDALINNKQIETPKKKEVDVKGIQDKLASRDPMMKSIDGFQMMLDLREADLAAGKMDPFVSANMKNPKQEDFDAAQRRADIYKECIEYAQGDPALFSQELTRRMVDPPLPPRKRK